MRNHSDTCCKRKIPRACANEKIADRETMAWQKAETRVAKEKEKAVALNFRQTEILELARAEGWVVVEDLAQRFDVTLQTIRRDSSDLAHPRQ